MRSTVQTLTLGFSLALCASVTLPTLAQAGDMSAESYVEKDVAQTPDMMMPEAMMMAPNIVEIAAGEDIFSTLVAALTAGDLAEILSGEGPYTVFAPTNAAFAALPEGTVEMLLMPENKALLQQILTYHVVSGNVMSGDLVSGAVPTVEGSDLMVSLGNGVKVNNANVVAADIKASNGVIHVIDTVIMPSEPMAAAMPMDSSMMESEMSMGDSSMMANEMSMDSSMMESEMPMSGSSMMANEMSMDDSMMEVADASGMMMSSAESVVPIPMNIVELAAGNDTFSTLVAAVTAGDLAGVLSGEGPYTVFAPTNEAFAALPEGTVEMLLMPENKALLQQVLTYHVVSGNVMASDLVTGNVPSVEGSDIMVSMNNGVKVNNASVIAADVVLSNGIIHVIDEVIMPAAQ